MNLTVPQPIIIKIGPFFSSIQSYEKYHESCMIQVDFTTNLKDRHFDLFVLFLYAHATIHMHLFPVSIVIISLFIEMSG